MTESILSMVEAGAWLAVLGALLWGAASVLFSPCHLVSVPLLVGFLGRLEGQKLRSRGLSSWVTVGVSASLILVAGISLAAGRILGDLWGIGPWLQIAFLILAGLVLLGAIEIPSLGQLRPERARAGAKGAATAGGVLGVTLGPCTFAFFAPLLAFSAGPSAFGLKFATVGAFVLAHLAATWTAGLLGARVGRWMAAGGRVTKAVKQIVGVAAIALAVYLIVDAP